MDSIELEIVAAIPSKVLAGDAYDVTIDVKHDGGRWPYDREEQMLHCMAGGSPGMSVMPIGSESMVLHRFGGTYGPVTYRVIADGTTASCYLIVKLINGAGVTLGRVQLAGIVVEVPAKIAELTLQDAQPASDQLGDAKSVLKHGFKDAREAALKVVLHLPIVTHTVLLDGVSNSGKSTLVHRLAFPCTEAESLRKITATQIAYRTRLLPICFVPPIGTVRESAEEPVLHAQVLRDIAGEKPYEIINILKQLSAERALPYDRDRDGSVIILLVWDMADTAGSRARITKERLQLAYHNNYGRQLIKHLVIFFNKLDLLSSSPERVQQLVDGERAHLDEVTNFLGTEVIKTYLQGSALRGDGVIECQGAIYAALGFAVYFRDLKKENPLQDAQRASTQLADAKSALKHEFLNSLTVTHTVLLDGVSNSGKSTLVHRLAFPCTEAESLRKIAATQIAYRTRRLPICFVPPVGGGAEEPVLHAQVLRDIAGERPYEIINILKQISAERALPHDRDRHGTVIVLLVWDMADTAGSRARITKERLQLAYHNDYGRHLVKHFVIFFNKLDLLSSPPERVQQLVDEERAYLDRITNFLGTDVVRTYLQGSALRGDGVLECQGAIYTAFGLAAHFRDIEKDKDGKQP